MDAPERVAHCDDACTCFVEQRHGNGAGVAESLDDHAQTFDLGDAGQYTTRQSVPGDEETTPRCRLPTAEGPSDVHGACR